MSQWTAPRICAEPRSMADNLEGPRQGFCLAQHLAETEGYCFGHHLAGAAWDPATNMA